MMVKRIIPVGMMLSAWLITISSSAQTAKQAIYLVAPRQDSQHQIRKLSDPTLRHRFTTADKALLKCIGWAISAQTRPLTQAERAKYWQYPVWVKWDTPENTNALTRFGRAEISLTSREEFANFLLKMLDWSITPVIEADSQISTQLSLVNANRLRATHRLKYVGFVFTCTAAEETYTYAETETSSQWRTLAFRSSNFPYRTVSWLKRHHQDGYTRQRSETFLRPAQNVVLVDPDGAAFATK